MFCNNVNIINNDKKFSYYFEYFDDKINQKNFVSYSGNQEKIMFQNNYYDNLTNCQNYWVNNNQETYTNYIPEFVNVSTLNKFEDGAEVTPELLKASGLLKKLNDGVSVMGNGEITKKLTVNAHRFTKTAKEKIEAAGGKVVVIKAGENA